MDLRKLEIFTVVADTGSFSQAALALHMAQPAVSVAVRKLEESLGVRLFDRSQRQARLTPEGREVLQRAQHILREAQELQRSTDALREMLSGEVSLACPSMLATYFLPDLLLEFLQDHPGLTASITQAGTTDIEALLQDEQTELGVVAQPVDSLAAFESVVLVEEPIVLCVAEDHPWSNRSSVTAQELHGEAMVVYESGYYVRQALDTLCAGAGRQPDFRMQSNFLPMLVRMVKQGLGATVGLKLMAEAELGIVGLPLEGAPSLTLALAKRHSRQISVANQAFLDWAAFKLS